MPKDDDLISRGNAYIFLKTLFHKSKIFQEKTAVLRKKLGIKNLFFDDIYKYPDDWADLEARRHYFDLSGNPDFREFCKFFLLPEMLWDSVAVYLYANRTTHFLGQTIVAVEFNPSRLSGVKEESSENLDDQSEKTTLETEKSVVSHQSADLAKQPPWVPYIKFQMVFQLSKNELASHWPDVKNLQENFTAYFRFVHIWRNADIFDAALLGYKFKIANPGVKDSELRNYLATTDLYAKPSSVSADIAKYVSELRKQATAVKGLAILTY